MRVLLGMINMMDGEGLATIRVNLGTVFMTVMGCTHLVRFIIKDFSPEVCLMVRGFTLQEKT